jgi:hypothetical protein
MALFFKVSHQMSACVSLLPITGHMLIWSPWHMARPKSWSCFQSPIATPSYAQLFSGALISPKPSAYVLRLLWHQVSHPYKTSIIIILHILLFTFPDSKRRDRSVWTERHEAFPWLNSIVISSCKRLYVVSLFGTVWSLPRFRRIC